MLTAASYKEKFESLHAVFGMHVPNNGLWNRIGTTDDLLWFVRGDKCYAKLTEMCFGDVEKYWTFATERCPENERCFSYYELCYIVYMMAYGKWFGENNVRVVNDEMNKTLTVYTGIYPKGIRFESKRCYKL